MSDLPPEAVRQPPIACHVPAEHNPRLCARYFAWVRCAVLGGFQGPAAPDEHGVSAVLALRFDVRRVNRMAGMFRGEGMLPGSGIAVRTGVAVEPLQFVRINAGKARIGLSP